MTRRWFACFLWSVLGFAGLGTQARAQHDADSLRQVWTDSTAPDTLRWDALSSLIWQEHMFSRPDSAEQLATLLYEEAKAQGSKPWQANAMNTLAISFAVRGELDSAIALLEECVVMRRALGQVKHLAGLKSNLGNMYADQGDLGSAIAAYEESFELAHEQGDSALMASNLTNIGIAYQDLGLVGKASESLYRSIAIREALNDRRGLANAYAPLADVYVFLGDTAGSLDLRQRAAAIYEELGDDRSLGIVYESMASIHAAMGQLDEAIRLSQRSLDLLTGVGDVRSITNSTRGLGTFLLEDGRTEEAIGYLERSVAIADSAGYEGLLVHALNALARGRLEQGRTADAERLYEQALERATALGILDARSTAASGLHRLYRQQGRFREALAMHELAQEAAAQMKDEALVRAALRDQYEYTYRSKQTADSLAFAQERTIQAERLDKERRTRGFLLGGLVLLLGFAAFAWDRYRTTRKQKAIIEANAAQLAEMDEVKSRFFTNISHEFRTPISLILGPARTLQDKLAPNGSGDAPKELQVITRNGERLAELIDQILELNKLEAGHVRSTLVQGDAVAVLDHLFSALGSLGEARGLAMQREGESGPVVMDHDREMLTKIVQNLVSNAAKFTPAGGTVTLDVRRTEARLRFSISDTGKGIAGKDLPYVFDRFYQSAETPDDQVGTGVGLALTRELVQALGGTISVQSTLGRGTRFTVELPITRQAPLDDQPFETAPRTVEHRTGPAQAMEEAEADDDRTLVLVVEDNPDMAEHVADCLGPEVAVRLAPNGAIGVELALELVPDVIVTDVMMPEKDGFALCAELKGDDRTSHIPIVMLTARADVQDRLQGLQRGADDYLAKPFHAEELRLRVGNLIRLRDRFRDRYASGPPAPEVEAPPEPEVAREDAFIQKVREVLEGQLDNSEFGANEIATAIGLSRTQFFRKIKALTGDSPANYVRHLRLVKARELLKDQELRISEVAYSVGFSDPQYFSRAYSKAFGASPSEDRG